MRTDVKIGIAVGLVLVVGVVVYMVVSPGSTESPDGTQPVGMHNPPKDGKGGTGTGLGSSNPDGSLDSTLFGTRPTDPWAPGVGGIGGTTTGGTTTGGTTTGDTTTGDTTTGDTTTGDTTTGDTTIGGTTTGGTTTGGIGVDAIGVGGTGAVRGPEPGSVEITMVPAGPVDPDPTESSLPPAIADSSAGPIGPVDPDSPTDVPYPVSTGGTTDGAVIGTAKTHVIRSNDKLWMLAEKFYGHGKHWPLLVAANPGLSPTGLVVGKTINIPPLPLQVTAPAGAAVVATGTIAQATDGTKTYIVAKNDSFWRIAARSDVYGNGIHYKLIAAANPGANSNSLKPGDKLIIPPLVTTSPGGDVGTSSVPAPDPVTATGEKVYVVKQGDNGMWGVSQSQYGDGRYFPAIAGRNPGVNPSRLKIGQKLIVPSLEQAKAFLGGSSPRTPAPLRGVGGSPAPGTSVPIPVRTPRPVSPAPPAGRDGEPDFS